MNASIDLGNGFAEVYSNSLLPEGLGFYGWKIKYLFNGDAVAFAAKLISMGVTHVITKILDGPWAYNQLPVYKGTKLTYQDTILKPWVKSMQAAGLEVWGYQYVYHTTAAIAKQEGIAAVERVEFLGVDGFVIDAEGEAKDNHKHTSKYVVELRQMKAPIGLASYRYPKSHTELKWDVYLQECDVLMPQVYWQGLHDPGAQLEKSLDQYRNYLGTDLPYMPIGSAYTIGGWAATPADIIEFLDKARELGCASASFWEYNHTNKYLPGLLDTVSTYDWNGGGFPIPQPIDCPVDGRKCPVISR